MFKIYPNGVAQWTSSNGKWTVFANVITSRQGGVVIGYQTQVKVYEVRNGEFFYPNMNKLPKYVQRVAEAAQELATAREKELYEQLQVEQEKEATNEPQPPKYIRENCLTCNPANFARETMEYTGKVEEAPCILDDGTKEMEYEYLYQCCTCGRRVWIPEQMAKESAVKSEAEPQQSFFDIEARTAEQDEQTAQYFEKHISPRFPKQRARDSACVKGFSIPGKSVKDSKRGEDL